MIRWGVLSTSNIGRAAVNPAIQASRNGTLEAVASRDAERARAFAGAHAIPTAYGSYQELLEDESIDAVYVPLPNSMHREWTIAAALAGKHVLCEKPLALDEAECLDMDAAAREAGVVLMEAFMYRFHPRTEKLLELLNEGRIGSTSVIRSAFTFRLKSSDNIRLDPELGGGALMDVGCYCVNVSRTVVGEEPEVAQATARFTERGVDDFLVGSLSFPGGAVAHFDCSLTMERCESLEIGGTEGVLRAPAAFLPGTDDVVIEESRGRGGHQTHPVSGADEYRLMVEHFADCALGGIEPRYGAREAAANMKVIQALYRSAREGATPVRV